ncbi:MAG: DEAD/DEAH box helicase [Phycisphaerales bacterium]
MTLPQHHDPTRSASSARPGEPIPGGSALPSPRGEDFDSGTPRTVDFDRLERGDPALEDPEQLVTRIDSADAPLTRRDPAAASGAGEDERDDRDEGDEPVGGSTLPRSDFPEEVFDASLTFESMGLRSSVLKGLTDAGFKRPTKIQALLIPSMLAGRDVLGQARTGTGKTAAFGLPLLHMCTRETPFQALVLVPTRELCLQVADDINTLGRNTPIVACAVFGGQRIKTQVDQLVRNPQIIVSTPGRLMDMVERRHLHLRNVRFAILDEVDRMLDIGFREDIRRILKMCPQPGPAESGGRQSVFVSATLPAEVERLARSHMRDPEKLIAVYTGALTNSTVRQFYLSVQPWDKRRLLLHLLTHEEPALTVVFCRTKRTVDETAKFLVGKGIDAHAMHGDMYQAKRNKVIEKLHKGDLSVLVASDLASRGLDVDGITHVINYDLPEDPEVYVHRIGRTARVGRDGVAWAFVTPEQGELLTSVEHLINAEIPKLDYPDFKPGPVPAGVAARMQEQNRAAQAPIFNRYAATVAPPIPAASSAQKVDASKFPGGIVPSKMPPKRMFGRVRSTESLKAQIQETMKSSGAPPAGPASPGTPADQ